MIDLKIGSLYTLIDSEASTVRPAFFGHVVKLIKKGERSYQGHAHCIIQLVTVPKTEDQALKGIEVALNSSSLGEYTASSNEEGIKLLNQEEF